MTKEFHVLTGGTSGMGLQIAKTLAKDPKAHIIVGARRPDRAHALRQAVPADRLTVLQLDLDSADSVRGFAQSVQAQGAVISSIICNAGLQFLGPKQMSMPGVERTFMVNVMSHVLLVDLLLPHVGNGGHVVTVGSGTHAPDDPIASRFGFRGASYPNAAAVMAGDLGREGPDDISGMDRYATSKLGAIYHAMALAKDIQPQVCSFYAFDPGLMPGTSLARERPAIQRFGWTYIMPVLRHVLRGVSSSAQSAQALVRYCITDPQHPSGSYIEFTGHPAPRSRLSLDQGKADELIAACRRVLDEGAIQLR